ncbi:ATP-binding protein [Streptomyces sp. NRRL F-5126]|uniref:ATP-binding protein n=1 Tax=Streptomyces sp. NRRL F-5126 TaxID=1463857 RepID=UPI0018FE2DA2|nr:ATP-binding protein [Streptomyces sp. NRRL F-5126]
MSRDAFPQDGTVTAPRFTARALPADGQAVGEGRQFTGSTLHGWSLGPMVDNAALIVSELLSNALRYGLGALPSRHAPAPALWLGLLRRRGTVLFAVCDRSTAVPELREPDYFAQSGRGLHIIDCLSETWGWTTPGADGKAVWAAVACGEEPGSAAAPAPEPAGERETAPAPCELVGPLRGARWR